MDVNSIVERFRQQMWTGPKRRAVGDGGDGSETEADEETERAESKRLKQREQERLDALNDAKNAHELLSTAFGEMRVNKDALISHISLYWCETTGLAYESMIDTIEHIYKASISFNGHWGIMLKHFAFTKSSRDFIDNGATQAGEYEPSGHENAEEEAAWRRKTNFERSRSDFVDQAKKALMERGFLFEHEYQEPQQQQSPFFPSPSQDMNMDDNVSEEEDDEANEEEEGADNGEDGHGAENPADAFPDLGTYEQLLDRALALLPDRAAEAQLAIIAEDHSMFAHAFDFYLVYRGEGGGMQLPERRAYFYRNAEDEAGSDEYVSGSNRNADLAAALRSLILFAVVLTHSAKMSSKCRINFDLHVDPKSDSRYDDTVALLRRTHALVLNSEDAGQSSDVLERRDAYKQFLHLLNGPEYYELMGGLQASQTTPKSKFVDFLILISSYILRCVGSRFAVGLKASGETAITSYAFPMFATDEDPELHVSHDNDDGSEGDEDADNASESGDSAVSEVLPILEPHSPQDDQPTDLMTFEPSDGEKEDGYDSQATLEDE
jgi:hypothetical protein